MSTSKTMIHIQLPPPQRVFVVAHEEYTQHGPGDLCLDLYYATNLDDLAKQLYGAETPEEYGISDLLQYNGDGQSFYLIKELVNGKLIPITYSPQEEV